MSIKRALRLCFLAIGLTGCLMVRPAWADAFAPGQELDHALVADIATKALGFIGPRTLEYVPTARLAAWGLRGLTRLDPRVTTGAGESSVRLLIAGRPVLLLDPPADDDAHGWGEVVAQAIQAAWNGSETLRRQGRPAIISAFFEEMFSHLDPYSRYMPPAETTVPERRKTVDASRAGALLVVRVSAFERGTAEALAGELTRASAGAHPPRGVVLDLRGNRGGLLREAVAAADTMLGGGLVARTTGRAADADQEYISQGPDLTAGWPVVVLVDGRTASAAEVLAAALADHDRAIVVGSATFGKGLVQTAAQLLDGGTLFVSWRRMLAPLEWPIQSLGVMPQICTSLGERALRAALAELGRGRQPMARPVARSRAARAPLPPAEAIAIRSACPPSDARGPDAASDMAVARFLLDHPKAYAAALIPQ